MSVATDPTPKGVQYGFLFDASLCNGCKTCEMACRNAYHLGTTPSFRRVFEFTGGTWGACDGGYAQDVFAYNISVSCNHCDDPACEQVCPSGAMRKGDDGFVVLDSNVCIGCRNCSYACPYGAPSYSEALHRMRKCDGCRDRVAEGMSPICVEACPMRALDFGPIDTLRAEACACGDVAPLPSASYTRPNLVIKPHPNSKPACSGSGRVGNLKEVRQ